MRTLPTTASKIVMTGLLATLAGGLTATAQDDLDDWNPLPPEEPDTFVIIPVLLDDDQDDTSIWEYVADLPLLPLDPPDGPGQIEVNPQRTSMTRDEFQALCESKPNRTFEELPNGLWSCCKLNWGCFTCDEDMNCTVDCESLSCEDEHGDSATDEPDFENEAAAAACQKDADGDGYADGIYTEFDDGGWSCCDPEYGCLQCHPGDGCGMMCFSPECQETMNGNSESTEEDPNQDPPPSGDGTGKRYRRVNHSRSRN